MIHSNASHSRLVYLVLISLMPFMAFFTLTACKSTSAQIAPALNTPPKGFTSLFNGQDLSNWRGLPGDPPDLAKLSPAQRTQAQAKADERMKAHWSIIDGVLTFDGKGDNLCTIKDYRNFELFVDWKIQEKGDSGIYLRGTPQVQIWDDSTIGSGGLYNNVVNPSQPLTFADNPPGQWNTFHITMIQDRVTVRLNGKTVTQNCPLENYWDRTVPLPAAGAIELQNHGNPLYFRNIFIRELP